MNIRKFTEKEIKDYCIKRMNKSRKYRYVNFWCFVSLNIVEGKYDKERFKQITD